MANAVDPPAPGNAENVTAPVESPIPEHLQGKSASEMAQAYQSLEKKLGHQANELGQLRQMLNESQQANQPPAEEVDFYSDPETAVKQALSPVMQKLQAVQLEITRGKLEKAHPDYQQVSSSTEFENWVADSPARVRLYQEAQVGHFESANELLSTFKEINAASEQHKASTEQAVKRDRQLRAASSEKGAASIPAGKMIRRADIQDLKRNHPERYRAMMPEITKAYQEKRVID